MFLSTASTALDCANRVTQPSLRCFDVPRPERIAKEVTSSHESIADGGRRVEHHIDVVRELAGTAELVREAIDRVGLALQDLRQLQDLVPNVGVLESTQVPNCPARPSAFGFMPVRKRR